MSLNVVLDTNVLLVSVSPRSHYYWILSSLISKCYNLLITNEITYEYEDILGRYFNDETLIDLFKYFKFAKNVEWINPFFHWRLIENDPDENKFVDCAIAGGADFIVTEDKHFNVLKEIPFPKVNVINIQEFKDCLNKRF